MLRAAVKSVFPVSAMRNSGSGVMTMSVGVARETQEKFLDVTVGGPVANPPLFEVTDGRTLQVTQKTSPMDPTKAWL